MFFNSITVGLLLATAATATPRADVVARQGGCNADNCARAVTGTASLRGKPDIASRKADCSSFYSVTITPVTTVFTTVYSSTTTLVSTLTQTSVATVVATTVVAAQQKRQAAITAVTQSPSDVPAYASPCSGTSRYSSACSCFGISTRGTAYAPTSTITSTLTSVSTTSIVTTTVTFSTVTSTTTTTSSPAAPPNTCSSSQRSTCGRCFCNINTDAPNNSFCANTLYCARPCTTASQCTGFTDPAACVYDPAGGLCGVPSYCATTSNCPSGGSAKRELARVFGRAEKEYTVTRDESGAIVKIQITH